MSAGDNEVSTPCKGPNPDDWFIERDGYQYPDDPPFATFEEAELLAEQSGTDDVAGVFEELRTSRLKAALQRRRHAREMCHLECPVRLWCLGQALDSDPAPTHGTWGGYYSEELTQIRRLREERRQQAERSRSEQSEERRRLGAS